jgi:hypothetical protein
MIAVSRILYTPDLFFQNKDYEDYIRIVIRFIVIPLGNTLRSIGAVLLTIYQCKN